MAKNIIPQGTTAAIAARVNKYEESQKQRIIEVCQSNMKYADVLGFIEGEIKQSKKMASFKYTLLCWKPDGVYQLNRAINEVFGSAVSKEDKSPSGNSNIDTVDVILADGSRTKVPFGKISLEELGEDSEININYDNDRHLLLVKGQCQFKYQSLIDDIVERTKELLATESIYKNQALEITNLSEPKIMTLAGIDKQFMVLSKKTEFELQPLRSRILYPEKCIAKGIPLKYGCLLEGKYGTGKTLLAFKLAKDAVNNGWSFVYLKDPSLLAETLRMCKVVDRSGHGVIVFVEDIDQVTRGNRDSAMQDILNTLDGGDTKDMNVITLFTTNHIELIEPTFLRGKRIGSVITMDCLDAETAERFIRETFSEAEGYSVDDDLSDVCNYIAKAQIAPAFMAEIVESTKSKLIFTEETHVTSFHIKTSVESYQRQVGLASKKAVIETPADKLAAGLIGLLGADKIETTLKMCETYFEYSRNDFKD
jgi:transitional endoplasmic reticulum ATPase|nr:MAG TPA: ATPase [Caudoviricetes sp.]